ncbi:hypothetical protein EI94DRAFT_187678 [Lactarius quietus]|nr:hypothetical protein EI94DRAFT_187678 [Lactarius quietus]
MSPPIYPSERCGNTCGRRYLWRDGLDYRHGTGHGVGHFLNVHEGGYMTLCAETFHISRSTRVRVPNCVQQHSIKIGYDAIKQCAPLLRPCLEFSQKGAAPGYYSHGKYGIRLENVFRLAVREARTPNNFSGKDHGRFPRS